MTAYRLLPFILSTVVIVFAGLEALSQRPNRREPIIDMHIHAEPLSEFGGGELSICTGDQKLVMPAIDPKLPFKPQDLVQCPRPVKASASDEELITDTYNMFRRFNIRRAAVMGELGIMTKWSAAGGSGIIRGLNFVDRETTPAEYRRLYAEGKFRMFGEIGAQYRGFSPADPIYAPYFALADELDIPVGIHLGEGPPGGIHTIGPPTYRVKLGSPLLLEDLLVRHPNLRVYVMHYGSPLLDEMIAMMYSHPNLYVDISCNNWAFPRKQFYDHLRRMIEAGFEKRIMFGSDQMAWPAVIAKAVESVEQAPFLTHSQRRDIFYNNAARFLRLTPDQIAADHNSTHSEPRERRARK